MCRLILPDSQYLASYTEAFDECAALGVRSYSFTDARAENVFDKFRRYHEGVNLRPDRVGADYYWLADEVRHLFIGEIVIRHRLNEALIRCGGHIGYGVRPSEWNKGYGTLMLGMALQNARLMGHERVLITCSDDNIASARVAEKN